MCQTDDHRWHCVSDVWPLRADNHFEHNRNMILASVAGRASMMGVAMWRGSARGI